MAINDNIKQILIDKNISPSYFADEIGVQRSSISHILSGRNRPSFDIIQKIIRRFPELGYDWIMEDDVAQPEPAPANTQYQPSGPSTYGNQPTRFVQRGRPPMPPALNEPQLNEGRGMGRTGLATPGPVGINPSPLIGYSQPTTPIITPVSTELTGIDTQSTEKITSPNIATTTTPPALDTTKAGTNKQIDRILIFYTDGTFREFMPSAQP